MTQLVDNLTIVPLPPDFQAGGFSCGQEDVDGYLAENAPADELAGVTRTYLVKDGEEVVAYVSVLSDAIRLDREERPTDHPGAPAIKIGLMGVRKDYKRREYQGRTIGCWLIDWVVGLARTLAKQVGVRYVTLDALNEEKLVAWYARNGFKKNLKEEHDRRVIKRAGRDRLKNKPLEEIDLPHVSMRLDILIQEQSA